MHARRRRGSLVPEIRVLAPSLERGLDDSHQQYSQHMSPKISGSPSNVTYSRQIYRSYDDDTDTSNNRYYLRNTRLQ